MSNSLDRDILAAAHKPRCTIAMHEYTARVRPGIMGETLQDATKHLAKELELEYGRVWTRVQILIDNGKLVFSHGRLVATGHGKKTSRGEKVKKMRSFLQELNIFGKPDAGVEGDTYTELIEESDVLAKVKKEHRERIYADEFNMNGSTPARVLIAANEEQVRHETWSDLYEMAGNGQSAGDESSDDDLTPAASTS